MTCECASDWRLEVADLGSGRRLGWLPFLSFELDNARNAIGTSSITASSFSVDVGTVFPHLRMVAFTRTSGPGASVARPFCEYMGLIERIEPDSDGNLQIGMNSIESWLTAQLIEADADYTMPPAQLCATLVNLALSNAGADAIPLTASYDTAANNVHMTYAKADDKVIYDAITDLMNAEDGPSYEMTYSFSSGQWSANIHFADTIGSTKGSLNARRGLVAYAMTVDATNHANWVRGRGDTAEFTADTLDVSPYPKFAKSVQWSDLTSSTVLQQRVNGELETNFDPSILPDVTIARIAIASQYVPGDTVDLEMNSGTLRYSGQGQVQTKSWSVNANAPTLCTLTMAPAPGARAATLVLTVLGKQIEGCC